MDVIFWLENLNGRDHVEDLGVGGKIILEWDLKEKREARIAQWYSAELRAG
jgi:hypothetical protein